MPREGAGSEEGDAVKGGEAPAVASGGDARLGAALLHAHECAPTPQVSRARSTEAPTPCTKCAIKARVREFLMHTWQLNSIATLKSDLRIREDLKFNYAAMCHLAGTMEQHFHIEIPHRAEFAWQRVGDILATVVPLIEALEHAAPVSIADPAQRFREAQDRKIALGQS
jgi:hypothetical protein